MTPRLVGKFLWKAMKQSLVQFSQRTMIHGARYTTDSKGSFFTKVLWFIITVGCFVTANTLVNTFWIRYKSNPTRMNVESIYVPISELPFPAVTFCNFNSLSQLRIRDFTKKLTLPANVSEEYMMQLLKQVEGFFKKSSYNETDLNLLQNILEENRYTVETTMEQIQQSCSSLLYRCRWENYITDCKKLFKGSLTIYGYCCSFNLYQNNDQNFKTIKTSYYGWNNGLSVILAPLSEIQNSTTLYSEGVRLIVNDAMSYPSDTSIEKMVPTASETLARITGEQTYCSESVKNLEFQDRECIFGNEKTLRFFTHDYKETNCDIECRIMNTIQKCNCLPYYYPGGHEYSICNFTKIDCLSNNYDVLHGIGTNLTKNCECPANCNGIFYDVRTNYIPLLSTKFSLDPFYKNMNITNMMVAHVFMGSQVFKRLRRDLLADIVELISNLGGVYGLFIGMSIISLVEVLYYPTIGLYQNYKKIKKSNSKLGGFTTRIEKCNIKSKQTDDSGFNKKNQRQIVLDHK